MSYEPKTETPADTAPAYTTTSPTRDIQPQPYPGQQQPEPIYTPQPQYQNQTQQQWPGQQYPQEQPQFKTAVPLSNLQNSPAPVDCPACGHRELTTVVHEAGNTTHGWAVGLLLFTCCCCVPYLIDSTKDVVHSCARTGTRLAKWHRSGHTEVLYHA